MKSNKTKLANLIKPELKSKLKEISGTKGTRSDVAVRQKAAAATKAKEALRLAKIRAHDAAKETYKTAEVEKTSKQADWQAKKDVYDTKQQD